MADAVDLPALGAGIGYRAPFRAPVFQRRASMKMLEITADHYFDAGPEKLRELDLLAANFTLIPHGLELSLGSAEGVDEVYWRQFRSLIERVHCPWWSEHIAFTQSGGVRIGHLTPVPRTRQSLDVLCRNIAALRCGVPLILENITYSFEWPGAEFAEPEFLSMLVEEAHCGLLLDVTNLYTNALNHHFDPCEWLSRIPREAVVQLHLAGGHWRDGMLVDSHSKTVFDEVWELAERVVESCPIKAIVIERDDDLNDEVFAEVERANNLGRKYGRWT